MGAVSRLMARSDIRQSTLNLSLEKIEQSLDLVGGTIKLIERIRLDAVHESSAAAAWIAWLKFGMSTSSMS